MGNLSAVDIHRQPLDVLVERLVKISKKGAPRTHTPHTHYYHLYTVSPDAGGKRWSEPF